MVDHTHPAPPVVRMKLARNGLKQVVSFVGATIILATFIAKDARKDELKELTDAVQSAENAYLIRDDEHNTYEALRDFERDYHSNWQADHERRRRDSADDDIHNSLLRAAVNSADETRKRLDQLARLNKSLPNGGKAELITANRKECADIVQLGTTLIAEIEAAKGNRSTVPSLTSTKLSSDFINQANAKIRHLYDRADEADAATEKASSQLWHAAEDDLKGLEQRYEYWKYIYYSLFAIGWLVTIAGILIGEPDEKTVVEELAEG
jgi:hypothetical protein